MPGILQEDIAVLQSTPLLTFLHQNLIGTAQVSHSLRKGFPRLYGSGMVLCHLRCLEGIKVNKSFFLPCTMKTQCPEWSWTRWDRRGRWLCTDLVSLHYEINQNCSHSCSPRAILAADSLKILPDSWKRLSDYTTRCAGSLEKSVAISCLNNEPLKCGRIFWGVVARSQV